MQTEPPVRVLTWSTDTVPEGDRMAAWTDVARGVFGPLTIRYDGTEPFRASMRTVDLGPVTLTEIAGSGHQVVRPPHVGAGEDPQIAVVNVQLAGWSDTSGRRDSLRAEPGRVAMIASGWPAIVELPDHFHQCLVIVPSDLLEPRLVDPEAAYGSAVADDAAAALITHRVRYLVEHGGSFDDHTARVIGHQLIDLIALGFRPSYAATRTTRPDVLLQQALEEIERRLPDPGLTAEVVAHELNVSVRYLQRILAAHGTTFRRWVNLRRVERCRQAFHEDPGRTRPVAAIALEHGFTDAARFSRVFRAHAGVSARAYRAGVAASLS